MHAHLTLKQRLYDACKLSLDNRLGSIKSAMQEAQDSANEETKSSAGDKHETGRSMMQLETEKLSSQLRELLNEQDKLQQINPVRPCNRVEAGALVITDSLRLYFSVSSGRLLLDGDEYFALSPQTPLGTAAWGRQKGEKFSFNQREYQIITIY